MSADAGIRETSPPVGAADSTAALRRRWLLAVICVVFAALRLPVACRQIPAQDEDYFAVPGLTILREGIPRIPYMPSRNPEGAFYKADEVLFTLPPLYFYWQAVVYWLIGPSTAAARVASLLCGVAAIVCVHRLAWHWFRNESAALWSAGLYAGSRIVYFPVVIARPDMLCGALGLGILVAVSCWVRSDRRRWLVVAGAGIGAAGLTHPFAIVPAALATLWTLFVSRGWTNRVRNVAILVAAAVPVFALWLPLIRMHPEAFRIQFSNAVLNQSGQGIVSRALLPWQSLRVQTPIFLEHVGGLQAGLMIGAAVAATVWFIRRRDPGLRTVVLMTWGAIYLHVVCVGVHPTKGYWCYTGALTFICAGGVIGQVLKRAREVGHRDPRPGTVAAVVVAGAIMLPGSGIRTVVAHLRHWDDINYDAARFTRMLIEETPADARLIVDPGYIFDFYRAGRDVTLGLDYAFFFSVRGTEYDLLVSGPSSIRDGVPETMQGEFVRSYGDQSDLFACYAEVYAAPSEDAAVESR